MRRALGLGVALQTCTSLYSHPRRRPPTRLLGSTDTDVDDLRQRLEAGAFFLDDDGAHGVIACDARQAAQHAGEALKAAVLTGERRCVIDCRVDTFESTSRRFSADDTARWVRRCANEVAFFFETCTLLYPKAASGAAPTAAGLPVEPLLKKWGTVRHSDCGLAPTDCFFVVSPSTFEELVALRRLYRAAMEARALVVVVNHGFDAPPPKLEEATEVYRLQPLDVEDPATGRVARVCVSRRFPADYEVYAARSGAYESASRGVFTQRPDDAVVRAVARQFFDEID